MHETNQSNPVNINTYNYEGQKGDQFKTANINIKTDSRVNQAIDLSYGQNTMVHSSSPLIAYQGLTNYVDKYNNIASQTVANQDNLNKSVPTAGKIAEAYQNSFPQNGTVVEVKTQSGALIGYFVGQSASLTDFGDENDANALIKLDNHKIFVYNASYTIYPLSAARSMAKNQKATNKAMQAKIRTHDGTLISGNSNKKH